LWVRSRSSPRRHDRAKPKTAPRRTRLAPPEWQGVEAATALRRRLTTIAAGRTKVASGCKARVHQATRERRQTRTLCGTRMDRPPPHVHGEEGVDGSSPSEGFGGRRCKPAISLAFPVNGCHARALAGTTWCSLTIPNELAELGFIEPFLRRLTPSLVRRGSVVVDDVIDPRNGAMIARWSGAAHDEVLGDRFWGRIRRRPARTAMSICFSVAQPSFSMLRRAASPSRAGPGPSQLLRARRLRPPRATVQTREFIGDLHDEFCVLDQR
jgi:hypothetical protein